MGLDNPYGIARIAFFSAIIGALTGAITWLFVKCLEGGIALVSAQPGYFLALPIVLVIAAYMKKVFPDADAFTAKKVIAYIKDSGEIPPLSILKAFVLPIVTIAAGGSAGKEMPAADMGAGVGSLVGRVFSLDAKERRSLMIAGLGAGFAAVFGTPVAGAVFALEVLSHKKLEVGLLPMTLLAGISSFLVASSLGSSYIYHSANIPAPSVAVIAEVSAGGIIFGLCAALFVVSMRRLEDLGRRVSKRLPFFELFGGAAIVIIAVAFSGKYLGLGLDSVAWMLDGGKIEWYSAIMKTVSTGITLNFGGTGGMATPLFYVGASAGNALSQFFGQDSGLLSALGLAAVFAGAAEAPVAATIMAAELFGPAIAPYALFSCVISWLVVGGRGIYHDDKRPRDPVA